MKRTALIQTITDRWFWGLFIFYTLIVTTSFLAGFTTNAVIWAVVYTVLIGLVGWGMWSTNLVSLERGAEAAATRQHEHDLLMERDKEVAARQHEHDLLMERAAQERDLLRADHRRRMVSIEAGDGDPGPSAETAAIELRREAERETELAHDRAERQARIAAYEAQQFTTT